MCTLCKGLVSCHNEWQLVRPRLAAIVPHSRHFSILSFQILHYNCNVLFNSGAKKLQRELSPAKDGSKAADESNNPLPVPVSTRPVQASCATSPVCNVILRAMESRPVATLWARLPFRFELLLFVMAAAVRYYHLSYPDYVVFDEKHFGGFTNNYNTGKYFFDIHPPLGKLTLYWWSLLTGYQASECVYSPINAHYSATCQFYKLRYLTGENIEARGTHFARVLLV